MSTTHRLLRIADNLSAASGALAAALFVVVGVILCYEVTLRYVFNAADHLER